MKNDSLIIWTVYDHPLDFPFGFVARAHRIEPGTSTPTDQAFSANTLEAVRNALTGMGLTRIERSPDDDPVIVESWI